MSKNCVVLLLGVAVFPCCMGNVGFSSIAGQGGGTTVTTTGSSSATGDSASVAPTNGLPSASQGGDPNLDAFLLPAAASGPVAYGPNVAVITTTGDSNLLLAAEPNTTFAQNIADPSHILVVAIDPNGARQTIDGFGASLADSSARLIAGHCRSDCSPLHDVFTPKTGLGLSLVHISFGAGEFSSNGNYSYDTTTNNVPDPNLMYYSSYFDDLYIFSMLQSAAHSNPHLRLMATVWSGPAWMKDANSMVGGYLRQEYYGAMADYIGKTVAAYRAKDIPIWALAPQNDPNFNGLGHDLAVPSSQISVDDESTFVNKYLAAAVAAADPNVKLITYEGNWSDANRPLAMHAGPAGNLLAGTAFHCAAGDASAQDGLRAAYPTKPIWLTQCGSTIDHTFGQDLAWYAHDIFMPTLHHGGNAVMLYNLFLDQNNGPFQPHTKYRGCMNCRGVITIDNSVYPAIVTRNVEYYILGQFSKFVDVGAIRYETAASNESMVDHVAFRNPNGSMVLVVHNAATQATPVAVHMGQWSAVLTMQPSSVSTLTWSPGETGP